MNNTGVFLPRSAFLFASLMGLVMLLPIIVDHAQGRNIANILQWLVLFSAIVSIGRSRGRLIASLCLLVPALGLFLTSEISGNHDWLVVSRICSALLYALTISCLVAYVLQPGVVDQERLFAASSIYLMMGILWAYFYIFLIEQDPRAFNGITLHPDNAIYNMIQILYFSFTTLTTTGYGDISPAAPMARMLANMQQILGTLYVAILIARLVGIYSGPDKPPG